MSSSNRKRKHALCPLDNNNVIAPNQNKITTISIASTIKNIRKRARTSTSSHHHHLHNSMNNSSKSTRNRRFKTSGYTADAEVESSTSGESSGTYCAVSDKDIKANSGNDSSSSSSWGGSKPYRGGNSGGGGNHCSARRSSGNNSASNFRRDGEKSDVNGCEKNAGDKNESKTSASRQQNLASHDRKLSKHHVKKRHSYNNSNSASSQESVHSSSPPSFSLAILKSVHDSSASSHNKSHNTLQSQREFFSHMKREQQRRNFKLRRAKQKKSRHTKHILRRVVLKNKSNNLDIGPIMSSSFHQSLFRHHPWLSGMNGKISAAGASPPVLHYTSRQLEEASSSRATVSIETEVALSNPSLPPEKNKKNLLVNNSIGLTNIDATAMYQNLMNTCRDLYGTKAELQKRGVLGKDSSSDESLLAGGFNDGNAVVAVAAVGALDGQFGGGGGWNHHEVNHAGGDRRLSVHDISSDSSSPVMLLNRRKEVAPAATARSSVDVNYIQEQNQQQHFELPSRLDDAISLLPADYNHNAFASAYPFASFENNLDSSYLTRNPQQQEAQKEDSAANDNGSAASPDVPLHIVLQTICTRYMANNQEQSNQTALKSNASHSSSTTPNSTKTLEEALSFSPLPRIVVEATPPYTIIHANASTYDSLLHNQEQTHNNQGRRSSSSTIASGTSHAAGYHKNTGTVVPPKCLVGDSISSVLGIRLGRSKPNLEEALLHGYTKTCKNIPIEWLLSPNKKNNTNHPHDHMTTETAKRPSRCSKQQTQILHTQVYPIISGTNAAAPLSQTGNSSFDLMNAYSNTVLHHQQQPQPRNVTHFLLQIDGTCVGKPIKSLAKVVATATTTTNDCNDEDGLSSPLSPTTNKKDGNHNKKIREKKKHKTGTADAEGDDNDKAKSEKEYHAVG